MPRSQVITQTLTRATTKATKPLAPRPAHHGHSASPNRCPTANPANIPQIPNMSKIAIAAPTVRSLHHRRPSPRRVCRQFGAGSSGLLAFSGMQDVSADRDRGARRTESDRASSAHLHLD